MESTKNVQNIARTQTDIHVFRWLRYVLLSVLFCSTVLPSLEDSASW